MASSSFKKVVVLAVSILIALVMLTSICVEAQCGKTVTRIPDFRSTASDLLNEVVGSVPHKKSLSVTRKVSPVRVDASCYAPSSDPNDCAACLGLAVTSLSEYCLVSGDVREKGSTVGNGCKVKYQRLK